VTRSGNQSIMENPEHVLIELNTFEKEPQDNLPKVLEDYLIFVAKTGNTVFPWPKIKPAVRVKLESIIADFSLAMPEEQIPKMPNVDTFKFSEMKQRIFEQLDSYSGIPFTMQRLCELLTQPKRHYKRVDKFMRGLEKVMLVVSTVEPLALGGEEVAVMVSKEKSENGREEMQPAMDRVEDEEVSMESPSKRIRLSSAEDEAGPCDSQDGVSQLSKPMVLEENGESSSSSGAVCAGPPSPGSETMMDIDAECTSSEARLLTCAPTEAGPASTSTDASSLIDQNGESDSDKGSGAELNGCDSNSGVTTSAAKPGEEGLATVNMQEGVKVVFSQSGAEPSSSEGAGVILQHGAPEGLQEGGTPDCSSSDQATVADRDSVSPTNSEAEPAGEVVDEAEEIAARENGDGEVQEQAETNQQEVSPPASVQSSEEANRVEGKIGGRGVNESAGAADSSDQAQVVATMEKAGEKEEDTSPDQSGTS